jgi:hypothetical protein
MPRFVVPEQLPTPKGKLMKNILVTLVLIAVLAFAGAFGAAKLVGDSQNRAIPDSPPTSSMESLDRAQEKLNNAYANLEKRQNYAMTGGGIGAVLGLLLGVYIARR